MGVGGVTFAKTIVQVFSGRAQWEEAIAGAYHPADEGLDFRQGFVVGSGDEPAVAKVVTNEAQPVLGQFAGESTLKGADAGPGGVYFTSHDADSSEWSMDGRFAGKFRIADIYGHFRTLNTVSPQWLYWMCTHPIGRCAAQVLW